MAKKILQHLNRSPLVYFFLISPLLILAGLYSIPLTGDQKAYLATAWEMWTHHEWRYPVLFGTLSFIKPPLLYWFVLSSWKIFGFHLWSAVLPNLLACVGTAYVLNRTYKTLLGQTPTVDPGILFILTTGAFTFSSTVQMEMPLVFLICTASYLFILWKKTQTFLPLVSAFVLAGLLSIVKSPLYSVLCVLSWVLFLGFSRDFLPFRNRKVYQALVAGIVVGAAWYVFVYFTQWDFFFTEFVIKETYFKRSGNSLSSLGMWFDFLGHALPWSILFFVSIPAFFKKKINSLGLYILAFFVVLGGFFSYFPYRVGTYLFPLVPFVCLGVSGIVSAWPQAKSVLFSARLLSVCLGMIALVCVVLAIKSNFLVALVFLMVGTGGMALVLWHLQWRWLALSGFFILLGVRLVLVHLGEMDIRPLKQFVKEHRQTEIVFYCEWNNIWHEFVLLGLRLGNEHFSRAWNGRELRREWFSGSALVMTSVEYQTKFRPIMSPVENEKTSVMTWSRWPKKSELSRSDLKINVSNIWKNLGDLRELMVPSWVIVQRK